MGASWINRAGAAGAQHLQRQRPFNFAAPAGLTPCRATVSAADTGLIPRLLLLKGHGAAAASPDLASPACCPGLPAQRLAGHSSCPPLLSPAPSWCLSCPCFPLPSHCLQTLVSLVDLTPLPLWPLASLTSSPGMAGDLMLPFGWGSFSAGISPLPTLPPELLAFLSP